MTDAWPLVLAVAVAHTVETVTGFGATVFALAVGSLLWPVQPLLVSLVVLGWIQSAWIVARHARQVRLRFLMMRVLPLAGVGLVVGRLLYGRVPSAALKPLLGALVAAAAVVGLWRALRGEGPAGLGEGWKATFARLMLPVTGGVVHGLFASGGPVIVVLTAAEVPDKGEFRATMSALWLVLNSALLASFAVSGDLGDAWPLAPILAGGLVAGIALGERLHGRIEPRRFRLVVQGVLMAVGAVLIVT